MFVKPKVCYAEDGGQEGASFEAPKFSSQIEPTKRDSEDYKKYVYKHKTITELGDDYVAVNKRMEKAVEIPGESATEEQVRAFYDKMGVPKDFKEYELDTKGLPEAEGKQLESMFRENALKSGLTKMQAKKQWTLISGIIKAGSDGQKAQVEAQKQTFPARLAAALEKEYPEKTARDEAATESVNLYNAFAERTGLSKALEAKGLHLDPAIVLAIAKDERDKGPGGLVSGKQKTDPVPMGTMGSYSDDFRNAVAKRK